MRTKRTRDNSFFEYTRVKCTCDSLTKKGQKLVLLQQQTQV